MLFRVTFESASEFRYPFIETTGYLDLSVSRCLLEEHYDFFHTMIKMAPHNFNTISHLNIEDSFYIMQIGHLVLNDRTFQVCNKGIEREFRREIEDRIFTVYENRMFSKIKTSASLVHTRRYLKYCRTTKRCNTSLEASRIFTVLVKLLIQIECHDTKLIVEILKTVFVSHTMKTHFFGGRYRKIYMEYVLTLALRAKFNMWGLLPTHNIKDQWSASDCPILGCLFKGKTNEMTVFLKYGFQRLHSSNIFTSGNFINDSVYCLYITQAARSRGLILDIIPFVARSNATHRDLLALEILFAICQKADAFKPHPEAWTECLSLIWKSLEDPFLSHTELYSLLLKHIAPNNEERLAEICLKYKEKFQYESRSPTKPRSLMHLARCSIRSRLRNNFQLPNGILKLGLPQKLICYLNLNW